MLTLAEEVAVVVVVAAAAVGTLRACSCDGGCRRQSDWRCTHRAITLLP